MCQCAGCTYDVTTGQVVRGPGNQPLGSYPVRDYQGKIQIRV